MADYSLDLKRSQGNTAGAGTLTANIRAGPSRLEQALSDEGFEDAAVIDTDPPETGIPLNVSTVASALETTVAALGAIEELRATQYGYALEADTLAEGDPRLAELNTASQTVETEIARVTTAAGSTLSASGVSYSITLSAYEVSAGITVGSTSSLTASAGVSLTTAAGAAEAVTTLEDSLLAVRTFAGSLESAPEAARAAVPAQFRNIPPELDSLTLKKLAGDRPEDISDEAVTKLAKEVASVIADPFQSEQSKVELIEASAGKLKPDRVAKLLE